MVRRLPTDGISMSDGPVHGRRRRRPDFIDPNSVDNSGFELISE